MTAQQKKPWSAHRAELRRITKHRMVIMDGAMGTMIQQLRLTEDDIRGDVFPDHSRDLKGNHDLLSLTRSEVVAGIHRKFLEAGSDIIETNTFTATRPGQEDYGTHTSVEAINLAAARIARRAVDTFTATDPFSLVVPPIADCTLLLNAPHYSGVTCHVSDASRVTGVCRQLLGGGRPLGDSNTALRRNTNGCALATRPAVVARLPSCPWQRLDLGNSSPTGPTGSLPFPKLEAERPLQISGSMPMYLDLKIAPTITTPSSLRLWLIDWRRLSRSSCTGRFARSGILARVRICNLTI